MLATIKHQDTGTLVVVAKLLTGYVKVSKKISDIESFTKLHGTYDADYVAYMVSWQTNHGCTPDGIIGPSTWSAIAKAAPTCSTAKNRTSGYTLALQLLLGGNLTPDAIYGTRTKNAVAVFQDACKLSKDGICGPKTWNAMIVGTDVQPEPTPSRFKQPVDYKQGAKPWGPKMYSNHGDPKQTMANSGCGPTAMANIVATLKDPAQNPYTQLAEFAMAWGDRSYENGTNWSFFPHVQEYFNFSKMVKSSNLVALKACLNEGGYVVCSMGPGYWTTGGHFITAWKYDNNYVYCNDPASSKRTKQNLNDFMAQRKQFFCYYPDTASTVAEPKSEYQPSPKRGTKIVDISKYQPTVDYDALIGDTSLIILRAGYRGTGGGISKDQKYDLHASELQKRFVRTGVYFFSIASTEDKAREEARMFYGYAKDYNPYFWAMDAENESITSKTIVAFVDELRRLGANKVGCYCANHLYQKFDYASIKGDMDFTWIPRYGSTRPTYSCDLWQYTSTGSVSGISGNVDLNRITGDGHALEWFIDEPEPGKG